MIGVVPPTSRQNRVESNGNEGVLNTLLISRFIIRCMLVLYPGHPFWSWEGEVLPRCGGYHIYPTPPLGQDMTQGQFFKRSLTGLNSEFSFS